MNTTIIILVIAVVVLLIIISIYNSLTNKKNQVINAFGTVDVQLKTDMI